MKTKKLFKTLIATMFLLTCLSLVGCGSNANSCKIVCKLNSDYSLGLSSQELQTPRPPRMPLRYFRDFRIIKRYVTQLIQSFSSKTIDKLVITSETDPDTIAFEIYPAKDGYYYIKHSDSDLVLGTANGSTDLRTSVTFVEYTGADTQLWQMSPTQDGYYYIINKASNLFLDICGASITEGNGLQIYTRNDAFNAQSWKFISLKDNTTELHPHTLPLPEVATSIPFDEVINSGKSYRIVAEKDANFAVGQGIEDPSQVILTASEDPSVTGYKLESAGDNTYYVVHEASGLVMEAQNGGMEDNTMLCLGTNEGLDYQKWTIEPTDDGFFYFVNYANGLYLDVTSVSFREGNWLQVYHRNDAFDAQSWYFASFEE